MSKHNCTLDNDQVEQLRRSWPIVMTIQEASVASTLSVRTLYDLIARGRLKPTRIGGRTVIRRQNLEKLLGE